MDELGAMAREAENAAELERMRRDAARAWLEHVAASGDAAAAAKEACERLRDRISMSGNAIGERVSGGHIADGSKIPDGLAALEESVSRYASLLSEYVDEAAKAHAALSRLKSAEGMAALTLRYLCGKPWKAVERELGYSHSGLVSLVRRTLAELYPLMPAEWRQTPRAL